MPQLSGKDLIDQILAIKPEIPTIICTGHSPLVDEKIAYDSGVRAFCMKPLDMTELLQTVRKVLDS
jgi:DNA-binding NtrC family response regulator